MYDTALPILQEGVEVGLLMVENVFQTPQTPLARTVRYTKYHMDEFPTGTNAIVAVLSYTGYDMEDAMIINKSSMERGLCHGQIYKVSCLYFCHF